MTKTEQHTIEEALARFKLVQGAGSESSRTACVMTALSWVAGESWTDQLPCAHPILRRWAIQANDHGDTTPAQRAELVKAGETGILNTWWVPAEVLLWAWSEAPKDAGAVDRMLSVCSTVSGWKAAAAKQRPYLAGADLAGADLADANLAGAYLAGAYLAGANLAGANLARANLARANLARANLARANLARANLAGAYLAGARYSRFTALPGGFDAKAAGMVEL